MARHPPPFTETESPSDLSAEVSSTPGASQRSRTFTLSDRSISAARCDLRLRTDPANGHSRRKQPDDGERQDRLLDRPCLGATKCDDEAEYEEHQHGQQRKANETQHRLTVHHVPPTR